MRKTTIIKAATTALASTMLMGGATAMASVQQGPSMVPQINVDQPTEVNFNGYFGEREQNFVFVPETTGNYNISSSNVHAGYGDHIDPQLRVIEVTEDGGRVIAIASDEGNGNNFSADLDLEAGHRYILNSTVEGMGSFIRNGGSYTLTVTDNTPVAPDYGMEDIVIEQNTVEEDIAPVIDETPVAEVAEQVDDAPIAPVAPEASVAPTVSAQTTQVLGASRVNASGFVDRLYHDALGRNPDTVGMSYWVNKLANDQLDASDVANHFFGSSEFAARNLDDEEFVRVLYSVFCNRSASDAEVENWINALSNGASRSQLVKAFADSDEWESLCARYAVNV